MSRIDYTRKVLTEEWCIADVQTVRDDLGDDDAFTVLEKLTNVGADRGINWKIIKSVADSYFPDKNNFLDEPVGVLAINTRVSNCLIYFGIRTIRQLVSHSAEDLLKLEFFGKHSLLNIRKCLNVFAEARCIDPLYLKNDIGEDE